MFRRARSQVSGVVGVAAVAVVTAVVAAPSAGADPPDRDRCVSIVEVDVADTTITGVERVAATDGLPEHCVVDGYVVTPGDVTAPPNHVGFQVALPDGWNGDFFFEGVGALGGHLVALDAGLERGYATATTDTGHRGSDELGDPGLDGSWALGDRPKQLDWAYRGVHVSTVATKAITAAYYGQPPARSVFSGCSNGGRQGLVEAQRYPDDFDGIIAQSPAVDPADILAGWIWQAQAQLAAPGRWLAPDDLLTVSQATLALNDTRDGLADGVISDPRRARFDPSDLVGEGLTAAQATTLSALYDGPGRVAGRRVPGLPVGHEEGLASFVTGLVPPEPGPDGRLVFPRSSEAPFGYTIATELLRYFVVGDPEYQVTDFDLDTGHPAMETLRTLAAATPELRAFQARGGRLLMTHGMADPAFTADGTVEYYQQLARTIGHRAADRSARLFLVPGMFHCEGGPGTTQFDALAAMEAWLDGGQAPDRIAGTNPDTGRTRPLCAYPAVAAYLGHGSIDEAANFRCRPSHPT